MTKEECPNCLKMAVLRQARVESLLSIIKVPELIYSCPYCKASIRETGGGLNGLGRIVVIVVGIIILSVFARQYL